MSNPKVLVTVGIWLSVVTTLLGIVNSLPMDPENDDNGFGAGRQDWGFVEVRKGAHKFWWLYLTTANDDPTTRPLAIWLQGGPGASSTGYGNFEEIGPLTLALSDRNFTWVKDMNVLFIDSPVGSGFSYVEGAQFLATDNSQIANDLVELMRGFYMVHPEFQTVALHIFAESYGGKIGVEFAYNLQQAVIENTIKSNLKSVNSIDGWISPIDSVLSWAPFLLHMGFVNHNGYDRIMLSARETQRLLQIGKFKEATSHWAKTESVIFDVTGSIDFYNVLKPMPSGLLKHIHTINHYRGPRPGRRSEERDPDEELSVLMNGLVRDALNIPKHVKWGGQSEITFNKLVPDFMKPATDIVELLLNTTDIQVNIITGQLDLIVATPGTVEWVNHIKWKDGAHLKDVNRNAISCNGILEGYSQIHGNFGLYWINRAGHMVPLDNPPAMDVILVQVTKYNQANMTSN